MSYNLNRLSDLFFENEDSFFANVFNTISKEANIMKSDILESEKDFKLLVEMPGVKKEDIKISLEDKYLTISVTTKNENNEEYKYLRKERTFGTYSKTFYVGDASMENIKASLNDGVLELTIEKVSKKEERKYIEIN